MYFKGTSFRAADNFTPPGHWPTAHGKIIASDMAEVGEQIETTRQSFLLGNTSRL